MSLEGYLDQREDDAMRAYRLGLRDEALVRWLNLGATPETRLAAFDKWLVLELRTRLDWRWAGDLKEKRVQQCRMQIDTMILALWKRGWMLDGKRLADRLTEMLDTVAKYQRSGAVKEFWPYFKATTSRYVGLNAEELQMEARSAGSIFDQVLNGLTARKPAARSIPELTAQRTEETLRAKVNRQKRQDGQKQAATDQLGLSL